jgi:hypothetical protein
MLNGKVDMRGYAILHHHWMMRLLVLAICILPNCVSFGLCPPHYFPSSKIKYEKLFTSKTQLHVMDIESEESVYDVTPLMAELKTIIEDGPIARTDRNFLINGWRWHTISVIRDLNRFSNIVSDVIDNMNSPRKEEDSSSTSVEQDIARVLLCHEFVCNFNYKGLNRVEITLFFPWLTELLPDSAKPLIEDILLQHSTILRLSLSIGTICKRLSEDDKADRIITPREVIAEMNRIKSSVREMIRCTTIIRRAQEAIFVPYIAAYVSSSDQEVFNRRVIRKLGPLNAQVHLVSMADAIQDRPLEMASFQQQIPKIARMMLPFWRKRFYAPKASCLDA